MLRDENTIFPNIYLYRWDLCNICSYFPGVYITTLLDANKIIDQNNCGS